MCPEADSYKEINAFSNDDALVRKVFDFSKDGGAIGVYDLCKVNRAMVLEECYVNVYEAFTDVGGTATAEVGVKGGDTDAILPATDKTGLLVDTTIDGDAAGKRLRLEKDDVLSLEIKTEAFTGGKLEVVMVMRPFLA